MLAVTWTMVGVAATGFCAGAIFTLLLVGVTAREREKEEGS